MEVGFRKRNLLFDLCLGIPRLLQAVVNVVKEAGAMVEAIAKTGFETRFKAEQDPIEGTKEFVKRVPN